MNQLLVIENIHPSVMELAIVRLADWMGVETRVLTTRSRLDFLEELGETARNGQVCIAASADTLAQIPQLSEIVQAISDFSAERSVPMLVYGMGNSSSHVTLIEKLGLRSIKGLHRVQKQPLRYHFSSDGKACLQQLAGLDFSDETSVGCDVFEMASLAEDEVAPLLLAEDHPVFVRTQTGRGHLDLYLWATNQIADVRASVSQGTGLESVYQWLLPAIVYLKACFGTRCWHNPNVRARLIIDDPLLYSQYGFLNYDALLDSMRRLSYGTSLAFIPWNYRRSQKRVANLFLANKDLLSLCVHGCDHTNHEFDADDEEHLTQISSLALERMKMHDERSGVFHEKVMVFPQGHFSSIALGALRRSGFVAAVNSSCYPSREEVKLTLGDLMLPAVCHFQGFPIFLRRDPNRIIDIAVDLFLGRAGFVVEHHEFVREGYGKWEQFVAQMNALDENLSWSTLIETVTEACLQKVIGSAEMHVKFFTCVFKWTNQFDYPILVHLSKYEPDPTVIKEIRVNGQCLPFHSGEGYIYFDVEVAGKASIAIEILDEKMRAVPPLKPSLGHQLRVGSRRVLSEFRDNTLARHPMWLECAKGIARHFKLTGDSR